MAAKQKTKNPKNWDVDKYKTEYESEEHWQLRKKFIETWKDKNMFTEDRLVALAQTFINVEFLGCKYPPETMRQVAELSAELAKDFRQSRDGRLKRTFVGASEAAEQRVKGRRNAQQQQQQQQLSKKISENRTNITSAKRVKNFDDLFGGLNFANFVVHLIGGRNCLSLSAQRSKMKYEERIKDGKKVEIYLNDKLITTGEEVNLKASKAEAFKKALSIFQEQCFNIKPNPLQDTIKIDKKNNQIECDVIKAPADESIGQKLDASNKGFKMMKMMGWTGGGLGASMQGREDPVNYLFKNNRFGLGNSTNLNKQYFREMLQNYINSEDIRQLQFEPSFTKDERACLHEISASLNLKSVARGTGEKRYLTISKKDISDDQILREILINRNPRFCNKYLVQVPKKKATKFPDHAQNLELDM